MAVCGRVRAARWAVGVGGVGLAVGGWGVGVGVVLPWTWHLFEGRFWREGESLGVVFPSWRGQVAVCSEGLKVARYMYISTDA